MKVVLVHDWLTGVRGGEKCLDALCRHFTDADLFTLLHRVGSATPAIERMRITTSFLQHVPGITKYYRYFLPMMPAAVQRLSLPADVDVVVSLSHAVAKGIRVPAGVPHVCYCFTPMRYAWHLRNQYFADSAASGRSVRTRLRRGLAALRDRALDRVRHWDRTVSDRVTHFVAISRTIQRRIAECYGRQSTVIYPPVDTDYYYPAPVKREDYYLCLSALVPYKRVELAIEACNRLQRPLVVIGSGPRQRELTALAGPTVRLLGWRPDEEVRAHLRRCRALIFPGCEDFGLVPLEAQACGTPVLALAQGGALETVLAADEHTRGTGRFFGEQTAEAISEAILWSERHAGSFSASAARQNALQFDTRRFERELVAFIRRVAGEATSDERQRPAA